VDVAVIPDPGLVFQSVGQRTPRNRNCRPATRPANKPRHTAACYHGAGPL